MSLRKMFFPIAMVFFVLLVSCTEDTEEEFDHVAQYEIERDSLLGYLSSHYYDDVTDRFEDITSENENTVTALSLDSRLDSITHTLEDIDVEYTMYVFHINEGGGDTVADDNDLVWVQYTVLNLENEGFDEVTFQEDSADVDLSESIVGWQLGIPTFKPASEVDETSDPTSPRSFINPGEGFLMIPSGLAYQNIGTTAIGENEILMFRLALGYVQKIEDVEEEE